MSTPIAAVGVLQAAQSTAVDSTAQLRYIRVTCYNADTVNHTFTLVIGATNVQKRVVAPGDDWTFGPHAIANGTSVYINNAEATTTTAPNYAVTGEY